MFKKYPKIYRIGKQETDGILVGTCHVSEKIDGANVSVWLEDGEICLGSRNRRIKSKFRGFREYVGNHEGIKKLLDKYPSYRLYGEYLVKHTISYKETAYGKMYLFDIVCDDEYLSQEYVHKLADEYDIDTPHVFGSFNNPEIEDLKKFVGESTIGDKGEGIVIKNNFFINDFGSQCHAKIVTEKFKEENAITFGGNNKHSETYWEMYVTNKYVTLARVKKVLQKLEPLIDERLDMKHIPRIINTVYHDVLEEEIWAIQKKVPVLNFKVLKRIILKKAKQIYVDILEDDISVADKKE